MEMIKSVPLVVISHYDRRPVRDLVRLIESITSTEDPSRFDIAIIINSDTDRPVGFVPSNVKANILYTDNIGMNIGSWEFGWRTLSSYERYIFVQDECVAVRTGWLDAYLEALSRPYVGLVGESLNWELPWQVLRMRHLNLVPGHDIDGVPANKIDFYLRQLEKWNIDSGPTGGHLQALIWAASRETLLQIDGFPVGSTKAECIAAEIAVSRKVVSLGKILVQIDPRKFSWFSHPQWDRKFRADPGAVTRTEDSGGR